MAFNPLPPTQNEVKYSHNKWFYRNDIETCKKPESKEKIELKFAI